MMHLRPIILSAFGICLLAPASSSADSVLGVPPSKPSQLLLAQVQPKDDDEDRSKRGRRNGDAEKGQQGPDSAKGKSFDGDNRPDRQRGRAEDEARDKAKQRDGSAQKSREEAQPNSVPDKGRRDTEERGGPAQSKQTEQPKQFQQPKQSEQPTQPRQPTQAEPRDRDRDRVDQRDNQRDRAGGPDRQEWRERVLRREKEKTSAQELSKIRVEVGKPTVIDGGAREFRREGNRIVIRSDDQRRIRSARDQQRVEQLQGGQMRTIIIRSDGTQIITVTDSRGAIIRRTRRDRSGREIILIAAPQRAPLVQLDLGPLHIGVPRDRYFIDSRRASRRELEMILRAPPVEQVQRPYMLEEIRQFDRIRDIMPRVNVSSINFETDSSLISDEQIAELQELAGAMLAIIEDDPVETFMLAGHTDATGSREYNLALSERRAEAVAIALSDYFGIPAENLVTQGYGPDQLLVDTPGPERENRRVEAIRLTPLLAGK